MHNEKRILLIFAALYVVFFNTNSLAQNPNNNISLCAVDKNLIIPRGEINTPKAFENVLFFIPCEVRVHSPVSEERLNENRLFVSITSMNINKIQIRDAGKLDDIICNSVRELFANAFGRKVADLFDYNRFDVDGRPGCIASKEPKRMTGKWFIIYDEALVIINISAENKIYYESALEHLINNVHFKGNNLITINWGENNTLQYYYKAYSPLKEGIKSIIISIVSFLLTSFILKRFNFVSKMVRFRQKGRKSRPM